MNRLPATAYLEVPDSYIKDLPAVSRHPSGRCSVSITQTGLWRLTTKTATLYSIQILSCGAWGGLTAYNGQRRAVWHQPSAFTGSFAMGAECEGGIIFDTGFGKEVATNITVNWKE
jgi:hypothetical protein